MSVEIRALLDYIFGLCEKFGHVSVNRINSKELQKNPLVSQRIDFDRMKKVLVNLRGAPYSSKSETVLTKNRIVFSASELKRIYSALGNNVEISEEFERRMKKLYRQRRQKNLKKEIRKGKDLCVNCLGAVPEGSQGCQYCEWWCCKTCWETCSSARTMLKTHEDLHHRFKRMEEGVMGYEQFLLRKTQKEQQLNKFRWEKEAKVAATLIKERDALKAANKSLIQERNTLKAVNKSLIQERDALEANKALWEEKRDQQQALEEDASDGCPVCSENDQKMAELQKLHQVEVRFLERELENKKKRKREVKESFQKTIEKEIHARQQVFGTFKRLKTENQALQRRVQILTGQVIGQKFNLGSPPRLIVRPNGVLSQTS